MEIKTKNSFSDLVKELTMEIVEEEDLEEATSTGDIEGYNTPFAFSDKSSISKKKKKRVSTNSTGYEIVKEELVSGDIEKIRKLIRDEVSDIIRDIWLKRTAWKRR